MAPRDRRLWQLYFCVAAVGFCDAVSIWEVGRSQGPVEHRLDMPHPREFFQRYVLAEGSEFAGIGRPVLFPGAAKPMPAYHLWTDDYLRERHGAAILDQVEKEKKETRLEYAHENWRLSQLLDRYNGSEVYGTAATPPSLMQEISLLPCLNCGGATQRLKEHVMWFSSGGTRSVIHVDDPHNIFCNFDGHKDWLLWRPDSGLDHPSMGWVRAEEDAGFRDAYGAFVGLVNLDDVDLGSFPGYAEARMWTMTTGPGDCAYLPPRWFHVVQSRRSRSLSVHVWWYLGQSFDMQSCRDLEEEGFATSDYLFRFIDCTWNFDGARPVQTATSCQAPRSQGQPQDVSNSAGSSSDEL